MSKGLLTSISRRRKIFLCTQSLKNPSEQTIKLYRDYPNIYTKLIRESKKIYFTNELYRYQSNASKTWEIIRKAINNKSKSKNLIQSILIDNVCYNDPVLIASKFNEFFTNVATKIVQDIHPPADNGETFHHNNNYQNLVPSFDFSLNPLTIGEVQEAIDQLKPKNSTD